MNRLERLYALQEELRRRAPYPISASRLADQFEVTTRTIERDLASLRNAGVPIDGDVGRSGGYSLDKLPGAVVFTLGVEEVVAILLAAKATEGMPFTKASQIATQRLHGMPNTALRLGDFHHLPYADASFDLVVSYLSLIDIPDLPAAIAEMSRVLAPRGTLLIANLTSFNTALSGRADQDYLDEFRFQSHL